MKKIQENHRSANVLKGTEALGKSESTCTRAHSDTGPRVWSRHSWTHRLRARQPSPQQPMSSWRHCRRSSTARRSLPQQPQSCRRRRSPASRRGRRSQRRSSRSHGQTSKQRSADRNSSPAQATHTGCPDRTGFGTTPACSERPGTRATSVDTADVVSCKYLSAALITRIGRDQISSNVYHYTNSAFQWTPPITKSL